MKRLWHRLLRGPRRSADEGGFSLVELMVASGVMATALILLAGVLTSGLTATAYSRERQSANQLANQALEQIRALPFNTLKAGLGDTDLAADSDTSITGSGCGGTYCFGSEQIAHGANATVDPLVPHRKSVAIGPTTYTVASYVTYYQNVITSDARRVTVQVSWTSGLKPGTHIVPVQTIIFSPSSCLSLSLHPISGPCQPSFTSVAVQAAGTVNITGTVGGIGLDHATIWTDRATTDQTIEQISKVDGVAQASGASIQLTGGSEQVVGRSLVSSKSDNDPDGPAPVYDSQTLSPPAAASASLTAGANSVTVSAAGGDSGGTTSTTTACTAGCTSPSTPTPRNCPNITGYVNENDGLQCGGAYARSAAVTTQATLSTLGSLDLAALTAQAAPSVGISDRKNAAGGTTCPTTSGDGCVRTQLSRAALDLSAGGLPANLSALLKPVGFTYFAQIQGVTDSVSAEAGVGSLAPTATQSAGTVKVYCASAIAGDFLCPVVGYATKTLAQITSTLTTPTMTITDGALGGGTTIAMSATITPGSTATTSSCGGTCTRTTATANSTPPIVSLTVQITVAGTSVVNATIVLDPGALTAKATYATSPT